MRPARQPAPTLAEKVAALRDRTLYPDRPAKVECIETHMSWVFLTTNRVYKLKKPVRYEYLDFSTPALRRHDCEEELRLNRRLAPDIYLGVMPVTVGVDGRIGLGGTAPIVDWMVEMRRLPRAGMLDAAIAAGALTPDDIERIASLLGRFYATAPHVDMAPAAYRARFVREIELNRRELSAYGIVAAEIDAPSDRLLRFLDRRHLIEQRARERRIVEGHGDLRPEHVHLGPPVAIIDCLEFNRALRLVDPVDEIGYLALECERLGAPTLGERVLAAYVAQTGDAPPPALRHFYMSFRACVRARLAIWHLRDEVVIERQKWFDRARDYLRYAARHADALTEESSC